jgi:hypothetical protein
MECFRLVSHFGSSFSHACHFQVVRHRGTFKLPQLSTWSTEASDYRSHSVTFPAFGLKFSFYFSKDRNKPTNINLYLFLEDDVDNHRFPRSIRVQHQFQFISPDGKIFVFVASIKSVTCVM